MASTVRTQLLPPAAASRNPLRTADKIDELRSVGNRSFAAIFWLSSWRRRTSILSGFGLVTGFLSALRVTDLQNPVHTEWLVFGFRLVMVLCAGLSGASAVVAWRMIPKGRLDL